MTNFYCKKEDDGKLNLLYVAPDGRQISMKKLVLSAQAAVDHFSSHRLGREAYNMITDLDEALNGIS
jgi:hypothetical protein